MLLTCLLADQCTLPASAAGPTEVTQPLFNLRGRLKKALKALDKLKNAMDNNSFREASAFVPVCVLAILQ